MTGFAHLGDELLQEGFVVNYVRATFAAPDGSTFVRDIVRSPGAVAVVPLIAGSGLVRLVRQYRPPYDRWLVEVPAGTRDVPGEPPAECGRRELAEEAGLAAGEMIHLTDFIPSPGMTDSVLSVFLATGCTPVPRDLHGPEEEHMELLDVSLDEALAMVDRGEITDAKTVIGLLLTARRRDLGG
ncbi:MAG TPA: NUDIX hydrolase [Ilumatobacter sp.]|nr:NUDIX hydrolase [Ilumatobacter sp.]